MALTFTKKIEDSAADKKHRVYEVTADGSTVAIAASSLNMNYIDYAIVSPVSVATSITGDALPMLSIAGPSVAVSLADACSSGTLFAIEAWGW